MSEKIIEVRDLKKVFKVAIRKKAGLLSSVKSLFAREYKYVEAVAGVNLSIDKGEIRGLIGPNGAGKSTIIKILSGVLYPTEGEVRVLNYTPWLQREKYVRNLGVVFGQKTQLWMDLPAIDSFELNRQMYNIPEDLFRRNLEMFKELLNISEVITKPVRQLSLGERMKCEIVAALLHEPPLVYLDEPTIGLDILSKEAIRNFIRQLNREKKTTFILTTHDLSDIEELCENVTIINKGTIVFNDTIDKLKSFFSDQKVFELKFSRKITGEQLEGFKVVQSDDFSASIEVDIAHSDLQSEVNRVFTRLPVMDININNISIEEVIKHIYTA